MYTQHLITSLQQVDLFGLFYCCCLAGEESEAWGIHRASSVKAHGIGFAETMSL